MSAYSSLIGRRRGGRLFEAGRLLTFSAFRMGAYSRRALISGWALIRINTVTQCCTQFKPLGNKTFCFRNFHIMMQTQYMEGIGLLVFEA